MLPCEFCLELVGGMDTIRFPIADAILEVIKEFGDSLLEMCQQRLLLLLPWPRKIGRDPWIRTTQIFQFGRDLYIW